jgi:hypothetical protein
MLKHSHPAKGLGNRMKCEDYQVLTICQDNRQIEQTESNSKTSKHSPSAKRMACTVSNRIKLQVLKTLTDCKEDVRHSNRIKHQDLKTLTNCKEDGRHSEQQNQTSKPQNTHPLQRGWQAQ